MSAEFWEERSFKGFSLVQMDFKEERRFWLLEDQAFGQIIII